MRSIALITFMLCLWMLAGQTTSAQSKNKFFTPDSLIATLSVLAGDSLKGRGNFTPELEKAALYITEQFQQASLSILPPLTSFLLPYIVVDNTVKNFEEVSVANQILDAGNYFFSTSFSIIPTIPFNQFTVHQPGKLGNTELILMLNQYMDSTRRPVLVILPLGQEKQLQFIEKNRLMLHEPAHSLLVIIGDQNTSEVSIKISKAARKRLLFNVVGMLPGKSLATQMIIISAHYDHIGISGGESATDSINNGANDNASGVAAMLSLMKHFSLIRNNETTLIFIAFAGEEPGLVGSNYMKEFFKNEKVAAVINLEMLGKPGQHGKKSVIVTNYAQSNIGKILKKNAFGISINSDPFVSEELYKRSDHYPFALLGIPASTVMCFDPNDRTYHTPTDEISTLDLQNMSDILNGLLPGIEAIVSGRNAQLKKSRN